MRAIQDMNSLYVESIRDLYNAENQLVRALPKMEDAATDPHLKEGFRNHLHETRNQMTRLESICRDLGVRPGGHVCRAMDGLIRECDELIDTVTEPSVLDAGLVGAAQKVEHYEISGYGTAREFARLLGYNEHIGMLQETLDEESSTDSKLTQIAENYVNRQAATTAGSR
ncbi:MAG: ferritin-like domain-containing protein [Armatimonadetes bacterium]|nr:ferritin-like domain-containing protein [Armatimonadota bacterium]